MCKHVCGPYGNCYSPWQGIKEVVATFTGSKDNSFNHSKDG